MASDLRYGIVKYKKKEDTSNIFDNERTMIYDSRVGLLDLKAPSLNDELSNDEINKVITYMKPLMINLTDRNIINCDNYDFYFNNFLESKGT